MIREFARVLKPGGIAAFSEPGARHSRSPMSQFEMRTYRVVENDIDVHALWRTAQEHGFSDIKLAVFNGPPFCISLAEFEDFLAEGQTSVRWLTATRVHQRDVRCFVLYKAGAEPPDSRSSDGLSAEISVATGDGLGPCPGQRAAPSDRRHATNAAQRAGFRRDAPHGGMGLGVTCRTRTAGRCADERRVSADRGATGCRAGRAGSCRVELPPLAAGTYRVEFDAVAIGVAWFSPWVPNQGHCRDGHAATSLTRTPFFGTIFASRVSSSFKLPTPDVEHQREVLDHALAIALHADGDDDLPGIGGVRIVDLERQLQVGILERPGEHQVVTGLDAVGDVGLEDQETGLELVAGLELQVEAEPGGLAALQREHAFERQPWPLALTVDSPTPSRPNEAGQPITVCQANSPLPPL